MPTLYKRKGAKGVTWTLNWTENGARKRQSLGYITKKEAQLRLKAKEVELQTGRRILPTGLIFNNFIDEYLNWYAMEYPTSFYRTEQIINQHLAPYFGYTPLDNIRVRDAEQYKIARLHTGVVKRATVNKELRTLKAIINKALDWEYIDYNPIQRLKYSKEIDSKPPEFFTAEQMQTLSDTSTRGHWWRFLANTGLRVGEAQTLQRRWIGTDGLKVISTEEHRTKAGKWREVPLFQGAKESLEQFDQAGARLFTPMNRTSFSRAAKKDIQRAGLNGSAHSLRHTFISHLVMDGLPLRAVQIYAGHSTIRMTEKYAHLSPGYVADNTNLNL